MGTKKGASKRIDVELEPDAWLRLERFIRGVAKAGPQHRTAAKPKGKAKKSLPKRKHKIR